LAHERERLGSVVFARAVFVCSLIVTVASLISACKPDPEPPPPPPSRITKDLTGTWRNPAGTVIVLDGQNATARITQPTDGGVSGSQAQICRTDQHIKIDGSDASLLIIFDTEGPATAWCAKYERSSSDVFRLTSLPSCCDVLKASGCYPFTKPDDGAEKAGEACVQRHAVNAPPTFYGDYAKDR
jgi:hypothetical protein